MSRNQTAKNRVVELNPEEAYALGLALGLFFRGARSVGKGELSELELNLLKQIRDKVRR